MESDKSHFEQLCEDTIRSNSLFNTTHKILVACSGGQDSMALVHFLMKKSYQISIAYFDHETRKGQSKLDGDFVKSYAQSKKIPFFSNSFSSMGDSFNLDSANFQEKARQYRYHFLSEILKSKKLDRIVTAHHADDVIETFFINISRSSGIKGLIGIPIKRGIIVRPMIHCLKEDVLHYIAKEKIPFVEDASNKDNTYKRNHLRNTIIPQLIDWDKNFKNGVLQTIKNLSETASLATLTINNWKDKYCESSRTSLSINIDAIFEHDYPEFILYEVLKDYGFNKVQIQDLLGASLKGKMINTKNYIATKQRKKILVQKKTETISAVTEKRRLFLSDVPVSGGTTIKIPQAWTIEELTIRTWEDGDYMKFSYGKKKLKKIFNEMDVDTLTKKNVPLLCRGPEVLCIYGHLQSTLYRLDCKLVWLGFE